MLIAILTWVVFGLIVGLLARAVFPGPQRMGIAATSLLGVGGSFVGGIIANALHGGRLLALHSVGFVGSFVGALLILLLMTFANGRRRVS